MPDIIALFLVFAVSLFFYRSGYYDKRRTKELKLHDLVKFIYGKRGQPIYREGCLIQTFGLLLGISIFGEDFALIQGIPILVSARAIFAISFLILGIAVFLDELLDRIRRM
jgi:hypothetical protein